MFALIRNLIGRPNRNNNRHSGSLMTSSLATAPTLPQARGVSTNPTPCPTPAPATTAAQSAGPVAEADHGETITLLLAPITARFPADLRAALVAQPSPNATVAVPLNLLVQQLSTGAVRLPLGYLRQTCSESCFADTQQFDAMPVALPLEDVLSRLAPAQLPRRSRQSISVPDSVIAPFGGCTPVILAPPTLAPAAAPAPAMFATAEPPAEVEPAVVAAPEPEPAPSAPSAVATPAPVRITMPTGAAPSAAAQAQVAARSVMPTRVIPAAATPTHAKTVPLPFATVPRPTPAPAVAHPRTVAELPPDSIPSPFAVPPPMVNTSAAAAPEQTAPAVPVAARRETSFFRAGCLSLPIVRLATGWPAPVLQELASQNLASENVDLPLEEVEAGLKQGRLAFTWRQIRAWTAAVQKPLTESALDSTALELPLRFVAPLFLSKRPMEQRQRPAVGEGIPNIFGPGSVAFETSSFKKEEAAKQAASAPATAPAGDPWDTQFEGLSEAARAILTPQAASPAPALADAAAVAPAPAPAPQPVATTVQTSFARRTVDVILEDPGKSNWTPMELVRKISRLKGVAGATMATQDGLLVAEQYPALVGVDTFCALTTQMFNRVFSTAMELRLGGPARMSFVAESVTYEVYRCGRLFMTVVSQPGEKLPSPDLVVIADHLTNQSR